MSKAINCILTDDLFKKILDHKSKLQKETTDNVSLTDTVVDILRTGLKK